MLHFRYDPNIFDIECDTKGNCINIYVKNDSLACQFIDTCELKIDKSAIHIIERNPSALLMEGHRVSNPSVYSPEHPTYHIEHRRFVEYGTSIIAVLTDELQRVGNDIAKYFRANFRDIPRWSAGCLARDAASHYFIVTTIHSLEKHLGLDKEERIIPRKHTVTGMTFYLRFSENNQVQYKRLSSNAVGYYGNFKATLGNEVPVDVLAIKIDHPEECLDRCKFGVITGREILRGEASNHRAIQIKAPVFKQSRNYAQPQQGIAMNSFHWNQVTNFDSEQMVSVENIPHENQCSGSAMYSYDGETKTMTLYGLTHRRFRDRYGIVIVNAVCLQSCIEALEKECRLKLQVVLDQNAECQ